MIVTLSFFSSSTITGENLKSSASKMRKKERKKERLHDSTATAWSSFRSVAASFRSVAASFRSVAASFRSVAAI